MKSSPTSPTNTPKNRQRLSKVGLFFLLIALFGFIFRESISRSLHYMLGGFFYTGWDGNFKGRVQRLNANNFDQIALMDITPPPLDVDHVSVGSDSPFYMFLKINRGEDPRVQDPRYVTDREQVEFTVLQGFGVVRPFLEEKTFSDSFTFFQDHFTLSADEHGQVLAVFYPSLFNKTVFNRKTEKIITAKVLNNPKITNEVIYDWNPVDLRPEDFTQAIKAFVDWHNKVRLIDRTETIADIKSDVDVDTARFSKAMGITPKSHSPEPFITVQRGKAISNGQEVPNDEYSYGDFEKLTGRKPWGYMGNNVVFISRRFGGPVDFWAYDPSTGLMGEKIRYPSFSGLGASVNQSEYQLINGHYFHLDELWMEYYGQTLFNKSEDRITVTLGPPAN